MRRESISGVGGDCLYLVVESEGRCSPHLAAGTRIYKHVSLVRPPCNILQASLLVAQQTGLVAYRPVGSRQPDSCVHGLCGGDVAVACI